MALVALEVNGVALTGAGPAGVLFSEPGVALMHKRRMIFGREAAEMANRHPHRRYSGYWEILSDEPLPRPARGFRSHADLAHGQLRELWKRFGESADGISGVILVVPAGTGEDRLALLLGIAEEAGLPVAGLVESGVAAVRGPPGGGACLHIEATGERMAVSRLARRGGRIQCEEILYDGRPGVRHLRSAITGYAAGRFVAASRFDPLDIDATEQELSEKLDSWLDAMLAGDERRVELEAAPVPARAVLGRDEFLAALERLLGSVGNALRSWCTGPQAADVYLSGSLASAPGCAAAFARLLACDVHVLPTGAAALGALERFRPPAGSGNRYVLVPSLPAMDLLHAEQGSLIRRPEAEAAAAGTEGKAAGIAPTHLVLGAQAWRIGAEGLHLGSAPQSGGFSVVLSPQAGVSRNHCTVVLENGQVLLHDHSRYGTCLNGVPMADSTPLRGGDVVGVGSLEFLVTQEVCSDGP